jgi:hypothetical protein
MPAIQAKTKLLSRLTDTVTVQIEGYAYLVDFGQGIKPRFHTVLKNGRCTCALGSDCPAVETVREYRKTGGEQAPEPPADYYMIAPNKCPMCGARAYATGLFHPEKGAEWECSANLWHYKQHHLKLILQTHSPSPWRFPPVVVRNGIQINAWDGANSSDRVLYPGVLEKEVSGVATYG